jgi:hypothetical protein
MNGLQRLISPSLLAALASPNDHYSLSDLKLSDANVNYKYNQIGEIRAGKPNPYKGKKKLSKKQRKKK